MRHNNINKDPEIMITIHFDEDACILKVKDDPGTTIDQMVLAAKNFFKSHRLPRILKILEVASGSLATAPVADVAKLKDVVTSIMPDFESVRHAVVSTDPFVVAFVILLQQEVCLLNYHLGVFSTETAAIRWLS